MTTCEQQPEGKREVRSHIARHNPFLLLWIGGMLDADGPALLSPGGILACLSSLIIAAAMSVMGETVIEDVVKLLMFGAFWLIWHVYGKYPAVELVMLGMMVGSAAGFLSNRLPKQTGRHS